ncbi:MAG: hypothetical protein ACO1QS_07940 [Verrucomicrobiota bacterium]
MSSIRTPQEKKKIAYERDHYSRGKHHKSWRKKKPLKKAKARRAFRRNSKDFLRITAAEPDTAPQNVQRKEGSIRQEKIQDWGVSHLKEFVATRRVRNGLNQGAKKARRLRTITTSQKPSPAMARTLTITVSASLEDSDLISRILHFKEDLHRASLHSEGDISLSDPAAVDSALLPVTFTIRSKPGYTQFTKLIEKSAAKWRVTQAITITNR